MLASRRKRAVSSWWWNLGIEEIKPEMEFASEPVQDGDRVDMHEADSPYCEEVRV